MNLTNTQQQELRNRSLIESDEFAVQQGDLIVAENVLTGDRRIVGRAGEIVSEARSARQLLKD